MSLVYERIVPYKRGVLAEDSGAIRAARWKWMSVLRMPHQPVDSLTSVDMEATPYQAMAGLWGEETLTLIAYHTTS